VVRPNQNYDFTAYNTTYGDNGNAGTYLVSAGTGPNEIDLNNAGNNSVTGGTGNDTINAYGTNNIINGNGGADTIEDFCSPTESSQLYANGVIDVATAIQQSNSQTGTGNWGSWLADLDGNDTIVGDADNTGISVGTGNNVVVMGAGNSIFFGGVDATDIPYNWNVQISDGVAHLLGPTWTNISVTPPAGYHGAEEQVNTLDGSGAWLEAGVGNDTIYGGSGGDTIYLSNGNNYVQCGTGAAVVAVGVGNNTILGGAGNDTITGGGGSNYIVLGSGDNYLVANGGNDTIQGGSGNSTIYSGDNGSGWATSEADSTNLIQAGSGTTVIFGGAGNDTLNGGTGSDSIYGGAGNDVITTGDGGTSALPTAVLAGDGDTTVTGGMGVDHIFGGAGNDVLNAGDGGTVALPTYVGAGSGSTTINGGAGIDNLVGGSGDDWINVGSGGFADGTGTHPTSVQGGSGNDTVVAGTGNDAFYSGAGATTYQINGDVGIVQINDSTAQDTLSFGPDVTIAGLTVQQGTYTSEDGTTSGTSVVFTLNQGGLVQIFGGELSEATFADGTTIPFSELLSSSFTVNGVTYSSADGTLQQITTSSAGSGLGSNVANDYEGSVGKPIAAQGSATATPDTSNPATLPTQSLTLTGMADLSATGNNANDILTANGGNDTLIAGSANNTLVGGGARLQTFFGRIAGNDPAWNRRASI
jgi:Ca2+-binding RTX toxin-like protein